MTNRLTKLFDGHRTRKAAAISLAAIIGISTLNMSAFGAPPAQPNQSNQSQKELRLRQYQQRLAQLKAVEAYGKAHMNPTGIPYSARQNLILAMPKAGANGDDLKEALEDVHGTIVGSIGKGPLKVLLIKAEKGKENQTEKKLSADKKNFSAVNMNTLEPASYVATDPAVPQAWHLTKMKVDKAWDVDRGTLSQFGQRATIAILDSGCSYMGDASINNWGADLTGQFKKIGEDLSDDVDGLFGTGLFGDDVEDLEKDMMYKANRARTLSMGTQDNHGHGTWVAATCAGRENGKNSVGVAPGANIVPIKIADGPSGTTIYADDYSLIAGMVIAIDSGARIVNISYGGMNNVDKHEVLHEFFKYFYHNKNGIIFVSAGNDGNELPWKDCNYINTVSALRRYKALGRLKGTASVPLQLVTKSKDGWGSNYGRCVDFTAPGIDIPVTNPDGTANTVGGTSFSSPICAGIAALILSVNPKLSNSQVQSIMVQSCVGVNGRNREFGFGMPLAETALRIAKGG